jgi:hypothetical protein
MPAIYKHPPGIRQNRGHGIRTGPSATASGVKNPLSALSIRLLSNSIRQNNPNLETIHTYLKKKVKRKTC